MASKRMSSAFGVLFFIDVDDAPHSTTITQARYSGVYEGGAWLAFPCDPIALPDDEWNGDDGDAQEFWWGTDPRALIVGRGGTPNAALVDMLKRIGEHCTEIERW